MLLSAVSALVVAQSSSEIPEGLMNNPECFDGRIIPSELACSELCESGRLLKIPTLRTFHRHVRVDICYYCYLARTSMV